MPRSNWKGIISFGLVSVPVILYSSENKSADISFHQIDRHDNARIKYQRVNANTGKVVPWKDIIRGYEYDENIIIPVPDEILRKVAGKNARTIDIKAFINKDDLNVLAISNVYYLTPDKNGEKGYVILRDALQQTHKIGISKVIISTKEYLAALMPYKEALVLCLVKYDKEVRKLAEFDLPRKAASAYKVNKKEISIAKQLIKSMSTKWDPKKYVDEYQQALHKWVAESAQNLPHKMPKQHAPQPTLNMVNFVELLRKSLHPTSTPPSQPKSRKKLPATTSSKFIKQKSKPKHVSKH